MKAMGPGDPGGAFTVVYDGEKGEVITRGFGIAEAIEVRKSMIDQAVRHAAVAELERLGYTVVPPERVGISLLPQDYDFIDTYDPDRERSASRQDMVDVLHEIQVLLRHGKGKPE